MSLQQGTGVEPRSGVGRQNPDAGLGGVQGMHVPDNTSATKELLGDASTEDLGVSTDDALRDRRGRGAPSMGDVRSDGSGDADSERN